EIWDRGHWTPEGDPRDGLQRGSLSFVLHGKKLTGRWSLVRMSGRPSDRSVSWLLLKSREPVETSAKHRGSYKDALPTRRRDRGAPLGEPAKLPRFVPPELATLVDKAPDGDEWLHEIKFDGYRLQ